MTLAPVVLFVYNRFLHTQKTVEALKKNELAKESMLYIYSDGPKNENSVEEIKRLRSYLKTIDGFKTVSIIEKDKNFGLANSVINGVDEIINKYGKVIVLEDDLITSTYFLKYMNSALNFYENKNKVFSVTGFSFSTSFLDLTDCEEEVYFHYRPMSWSWGTWLDRWEKVDWEIKDYSTFVKNKEQIKEFNKGGEDLSDMLKYQLQGYIDSWYIRWSYNAYKFKMYTVYPKKSLINNIGHDDSGVHGKKEKKSVFSHDELSHNKIIRFKQDISIDIKLIRRFNSAFKPTKMAKIKIAIKRMLFK